MDNTETFIKMSDCPEIQALPKLMGDLLWHPKYGYAICAGVLEHGHFATIGTGGVSTIRYWDKDLDGRVWLKLPRQDQLQGMCGVTKAWHFHEWAKRISFGLHSPPDVLMHYKSDWSMEQLWLAFAMKEKYKKIRNGENWIAKG